jgi:predicted nuclease of predicted toxin-antitoxin system
LRLLLDEMYPPALAEALRTAGLDARTASEIGLAGRPDHEVMAAAIANGFTVVTENVVDFARISADHLAAGGHHPGVLIALSSRFSRRPAGRSALVAAIRAVAAERLDDRIVYLEQA